MITQFSHNFHKTDEFSRQFFIFTFYLDKREHIV